VICERREATEKHHLIPRANGGERYRTIPVCKECGRGIHRSIPNKKLETTYNSIANLKEFYHKNGCKWIPRKQKKNRNLQKKLKEIDIEIRRAIGKW
jgi:hypothetical protein